MTISNHKPYTYPEGKNDIPLGRGQNGAIKYINHRVIRVYRKLGLQKECKVMILGNQKTVNFYKWKVAYNSLKSLPLAIDFLQNTISWYQVNNNLKVNNGLKTID